jgi:ECF transporter S component (folate family)
MKDSQLSPTRKMTIAAMLTALSVIMTFIAKTVPMMEQFPYLRFSLTPALVIYTSLSLGPLYGAIVGAAADLIPAFALPTGTGDWNFLITLVYVILGILPWALQKATKHFRGQLRKPWALYSLMAADLAILACFFYATNWLDSSFGSGSYWIKPTILAVLLVLDVGLGFGLYYTNKYYQKRILDYPDIPCPNEIAFIALVCEVVVMDALKALAFWAWYNFLANSTFPLSFGLVFSMLLMASPINVLLITFTDAWLLIYTKRFIRSYGWLDEAGKTPKPTHMADDKVVEEPIDPEEERKAKRAKIGWILFFSLTILAMIICVIVIHFTSSK